MDPGRMLRAPVFKRLREDIDPKSVRRTEPRAAARPTAEAAARFPDTEIDAVLGQLDNKTLPSPSQWGGTRSSLRISTVSTGPPTPLSSSRRSQARPAALFRAGLALHAHAPRRPAAHHDPHARGHRRGALFQKHWDPELPAFAKKITIFSEHKDERHDYLLLRQPRDAAVARAVGTLEFHVWHSRAKPGPDAVTQRTDFSSSLAALESSILTIPITVVFDIDPSHLLWQGGAGGRARAEHGRFRKRKGSGVPAARIAFEHGVGGNRENLRQDGTPRVRADRAHARFRRGAQVSEMVGRHLVRLHRRTSR